MRSVRQIGTTLLLCGSAACLSCTGIDDISVGAVEQDAGSELEPPSVPATSAADSGAPPPRMVSDAGRDASTDEEREEEEDDDRREARDAGSAPDGALASEAGTLDAGSLAAAADAGNELADAGVDAASEERDASASDAGTDAARSLLCTLEPWHCL